MYNVYSNLLEPYSSLVWETVLELDHSRNNSPISEQDQPVLWNDSYKKIDWLLNSSFWIQFTDSMLHFLS